MKKAVIIPCAAVLLIATFVLYILYIGIFNDSYDFSSDPKDSDFSIFNNAMKAGNHFTIQSDIRLFTLYAFLVGITDFNETYGLSLSKDGQELKQDIGAILKNIDPKIVDKWRSFLIKQDSNHYSYIYYTMTLGVAPDFKHIVRKEELSDYKQIKTLRGFNKILSEFYSKAGINDLYNNKYNKVLEGAVEKYEIELIQYEIDYIYEYLRMDNSLKRITQIYILPNPFGISYTSFSINYKDATYIIDGPHSNGEGLNIREYLYGLITPVVVRNLKHLNDEYDKILRDNADRPMVKDNFNNTESYVIECLARALDYRIRLNLDDFSEHIIEMQDWIMQDEYDGGLVLVRVFYNMLESFEMDKSLAFENFIQSMLQDAYKQLA